MIEKIINQLDKLDFQIENLETQSAEITRLLEEATENSNNVIEETEKEYSKWEAHNQEIFKLKSVRDHILRDCRTLEPDERVFLARHSKRPHIEDFVEGLFSDFFEQKGDHLFDDDKSIYGGIAKYHGVTVQVIGHRKGHTVEEKMEYNFGMP